MCGIAGILEREEQPDQQLLWRMINLLAHRGPDRQQVCRVGHFGLAHARLSIIDLENGDQPMVSADGRFFLAANGEIYNFIELRRELEGFGCRFTTNSDCETIMHAYAVYGDDFLSRLHGMFAFALYDSHAGALILARDRLGIKPLFYASLANRFIFASELKSLLPAMPGQSELMPEALVQFLQNQFNTGKSTIIKGINRLLPGQSVKVSSSLEMTTETYWSSHSVQSREMNFNQACEEFEPLVKQVMIEHMRSDVPYGLFLSGGVDSAVLLVLLKKYQEHPVRTFSVGYSRVKMKDELDDAQKMAETFQTLHTPLKLDRQETLNRLPYSIWMADDLMRDYACLPTAALAERAGMELKVVFTGEGGDEVFAGYRRYRQNLESLIKRLIVPGTGGFRVRGQLKPFWVSRLFSPELKHVLNQARSPFIQAWKGANPSWSRLQKCQYTDMATALPDNLLVKVDRMLMGFGVEGRVPFLDHRLVEFGLSLPDSLKIQGRQGKVFLKRWAESFLPAGYLRRPKRGFHVPIGEWLSGSFVDQLIPKLLRSAGIKQWFDLDAVRRLGQYQQQKQRGNRELWSLMQFAIWHRLFIEGTACPPAPLEDPLEWLG